MLYVFLYTISSLPRQQNWSPLVLIYRSRSFFFIHVNVDIEIKSKEKKSALVVVGFISKRPGSYAIYRRNARVLEMQNFILAYIKGWTYVRTIFSEPKFFGCIDYHISLPMVLRYRK